MFSNIINREYKIFHIVSPSHGQLRPVLVSQVRADFIEPRTVDQLTKFGDVAIYRRPEDLLIQPLGGATIKRSETAFHG